jgi:hypothetical protein
MRDGRAWRIGREPDVAWINDGTKETLAITRAVPPGFEAYWTLEVPYSGESDWSPQEAAQFPSEVVDVLAANTDPQPWWLGFLNRLMSSDVIFNDVPTVAIYNGGYVLVEARPHEARTWRTADGGPADGQMPDLMFPTDRSWLANWPWDDDWICFGGSRALKRDVLEHPDLGRHARAVAVSDAAWPPRPMTGEACASSAEGALSLARPRTPCCPGERPSNGHRSPSLAETGARALSLDPPVFWVDSSEREI